MADAPSETHASRKRVLAVAGLWTAVMAATSFAAGCYNQACDGDVQVYGRNPGEGRMLSADTWESSPVDGVWLPFPGARVWIFELGELGDREPQIIIPSVSAQRDPTHDEGGNSTIAAGNLAEQSGIGKGRITIKNGTCADYYLRLVVVAAPRPPSAAGADSGAGP